MAVQVSTACMHSSQIFYLKHRSSLKHHRYHSHLFNTPLSCWIKLLKARNAPAYNPCVTIVPFPLPPQSEKKKRKLWSREKPSWHKKDDKEMRTETIQTRENWWLEILYPLEGKAPPPSFKPKSRAFWSQEMKRMKCFRLKFLSGASYWWSLLPSTLLNPWRWVISTQEAWPCISKT